MNPFHRLGSWSRQYVARELDSFEQRVLSAFERLFSVAPHLDGEMLEFAIAAAGTSAVSHKLQRQPVGWLVVDRDANAELVRTAWDDTSITLAEQNTVAANVKVWVF